MVRALFTLYVFGLLLFTQTIRSQNDDGDELFPEGWILKRMSDFHQIASSEQDSVMKTRSSAVQSPTCPPKWVERNQLCYYVSEEEVVYSQAATTCRKMTGVVNSRLVSMQSREENQFVFGLITPPTRGVEPPIKVWIGLSRADEAVDHNSRFQWIDQSPFNYTNWASSEPNNEHGSEYCVEMYPGTTAYLASNQGRWNDEDCTFERRYVCKAEQHIPECRRDYERCNDARTCIHKHWKCDGDGDCPNGDDEWDCTNFKCRGDRKKCVDGKQCTLKKNFCDGKRDCRDGSDEKKCEDRKSYS